MMLLRANYHRISTIIQYLAIHHLVTVKKITARPTFMRKSLLLILTTLAVVIYSRGAGRDFYKILGVSRKADDGQIKKAYRQLSRQWHPDQNPDNKEEATEKFYDISDAYETLIDPDRRAKYDLGGEEAANGGGGGAGQGGHFHRGDPYEQFRTFFQFFGDGGGFEHHGGGGGFPGGGFPGGGFQQPAKNLYDENSGVTEIANVNDWNSKVVQRSEIVVVDFYSPTCKPCIELKDQYISVAKTFSGIVQIAAVNCQSAVGRQICQSQQVSGYPTIRLFGDDNKIVDFQSSQTKNSKNIGNWISSSMPDFTSKIDSKQKLNQFISTSGSKAVVILFSDKAQTPALIKGICRSFKTNVACGIILSYSVSSPPNWIESVGTFKADVTKTPSLFYLHDPVTYAGEFFKGSMTSEIISLFYSRVVSHKSRQVTVDQLTAQRREDCSPSDSTICVLLLSNPNSDKARASYSLLKQLAERYKSDPIKFFWINDGSKFASIFEHTGSSKLVAYRGKRGKYSAFETETVNFESLNDWLDNIVTGGSGLPFAVSRKGLHDEL